MHISYYYNCKVDIILKNMYHLFLILFTFIVLFSVFYSLEKVWADSVIATIPVPSPSELAYVSGHGEMYVASLPDNIVFVINTTTFTVDDDISVATYPTRIAYDPVNH